MFCSTVLALGIGGSRISVAFKIEFIVTKSTAGSCYYCYKWVPPCGKDPRSASEKHRQIKKDTISPYPLQYLVFSDRILFHPALADNHLFSELLYRLSS